uniref:Uncharacterized protein n=1 Tax=viral metagenome TaxID=1070528 RepID=A0A6C0BLA3_9ZZZZ
MILKSGEIELLSPWLDVILYCNSSTLNMSNNPLGGLGSTRRSLHHPHIGRIAYLSECSVLFQSMTASINAIAVELMDTIAKTVSG